MCAKRHRFQAIKLLFWSSSCIFPYRGAPCVTFSACLFSLRNDYSVPIDIPQLCSDVVIWLHIKNVSSGPAVRMVFSCVDFLGLTSVSGAQVVVFFCEFTTEVDHSQHPQHTFLVFTRGVVYCFHISLVWLHTCSRQLVSQEGDSFHTKLTICSHTSGCAAVALC